MTENAEKRLAITILGAVLTLLTLAAMAWANSMHNQLEKLIEGVVLREGRISSLESDSENLREWLLRIDTKLDKIINMQGKKK